MLIPLSILHHTLCGLEILTLGCTLSVKDTKQSYLRSTDEPLTLLSQVLIKNRWTVLYCTLLAKTKGEEERAAIEEEMRADPAKEAVLRVSGAP